MRDVLWWNTGFGGFKISIFTPRFQDLPRIRPKYFVKLRKLPCAPLHLLLFLKLREWDDRQYSPCPDQLTKVLADAYDIMFLLWTANARYNLNITKQRQYITDSFRNDSYMRVTKFALVWQESRWLFMSLLRTTL